MTFSPCSIAPLTKSSVADVFANASACRASMRNASSLPRLRSVDVPRRRRAVASFPARSAKTFLIARAPVPAGTSTGSHVRSFGGSASTSSFDRRSMTPCSWTVSSSMFEAPPVFQPNSPFLRRAVALREREEAAPERMAASCSSTKRSRGRLVSGVPVSSCTASARCRGGRGAPSARARACCARWCGSSGSGPRRTRAPPTARAGARRCAGRGCRS